MVNYARSFYGHFADLQKDTENPDKVKKMVMRS